MFESIYDINSKYKSKDITDIANKNEILYGNIKINYFLENK